MTELVSVIGLLLLVSLIVVVFLYAFVGVWALPFFLLGLLARIIFFPLSIINTIFYPVGTLPYLIVLGFLAYGFLHLLLIFIQKFVPGKK